MDHIIEVVVGCIALLTVYGMWRYVASKPAAPIFPDETEQFQINPCKECRFFDVEAGQKLLDNYPVFRAASQHIPPWKMMLAKNRVAEAVREGEGALEELNERMHEEPEILASSTFNNTAEIVKLEWSQLGLCSIHQRIEFPINTCERFEERTHLRVVK